MAASPNFDLHCHPTTKTIMGNIAWRKRQNCWEFVDVGTIDRIMNDSLSSQASLTQLSNGHVNLAVVGLYGVEFAFGNSTVMHVLDCLSDKIDDGYFQAIRDGQLGYLSSVMIEIRHLMDSAKLQPDGMKMKLINSIDEYDASDTDTIHLILSLEGGHNLDPVSQLGSMTEAEFIDAVTTNLRNFFKNPASFNFTGRLLHLTITHLANNLLANHSWGMPELLGGPLGSDSFNPSGNGLTEAGKAVVREALRTEDEVGKPLHRVLIDIKHMSLKARQDYYELMRTEYADQSIPIVVSHVGVTGLPTEHIYGFEYNVSNPGYNRLTYHRAPGRVKNTHFNPWTINLTDEDIVEVLKSGGLIGLSLDQRILGTDLTEAERFSKMETTPAILLSVQQPQGGFEANWPDQNEQSWDLSGENIQKFSHLRHFCNNILHIVLVAEEKLGQGDEAWNHLCIGSDFDGLINAMDYAKTSADLGILRKGVNTWLRKFAANVGIQRNAAFWNGVTDKIFFQNGHDFLKKHFKGLPAFPSPVA